VTLSGLVCRLLRGFHNKVLLPALPTPPPFSAHDINRAHQALVQNKYRRELRVRDPDELDQDPAQFAELVVIGRSNVGKSSLLNAMWRQEGLAPCSKTPGRTQTFDLYTTPAVPELRVMDVPGYGFTRAPCSVVFDWHAKLSAYLNDRGQELLGRVYVLLDARRGVTQKDREVLEVLAALSQMNTYMSLCAIDLRYLRSGRLLSVVVSKVAVYSHHRAPSIIL